MDIYQLKEIVREAGEAIMAFYGGDVGIRDKGDKSPVTEADLASERVILGRLNELEGDFGILSEETEDDLKRLAMDRVFVIDPLDGTKDFINQTGDFTVMLGVVENGEAVKGVVYQPVKDRMFFAERGKGAFLEEKGLKSVRLEVSGFEDFGAVRLLISKNHLRKLEQKIAEELGIGELIPCGSAGLKMSLIAAGEAELYLNTSNKTFEWDVCAASVILEEAGGWLTDMKGEEIAFNKRDPRNSDGFVAGSGKFKKQVLELIGKFI